MPSLRGFKSLVAVALCMGGWLGCSSADSEGTASQDEKVGHIDQAATTCSSSTGCCTGGVLAWDMTDSFQAQLSAWGCLKPRVYQPSATTPNAWWFWARCVDTSSRVENFIASNSKYRTAPYLASVSTTLNPVCVPKPPTGSVDVLWDPTCSTCKFN